MEGEVGGGGSACPLRAAAPPGWRFLNLRMLFLRKHENSSGLGKGAQSRKEGSWQGPVVQGTVRIVRRSRAMWRQKK